MMVTGSPIDDRGFHPGIVLAFLDDLVVRFGSYRLPAVERAWDATWLACMSSDPRHERDARLALADVVVQFDGLALPGLPPGAGELARG